MSPKKQKKKKNDCFQDKITILCQAKPEKHYSPCITYMGKGKQKKKKKSDI